MSEVNQNTQLVNTKSNFNTIEISQFQDLISTLIKNPKNGISTERDVVLIILKAKELGVGLSSMLDHSSVIQGKVALDYHVIKSILDKPGSGVSWDLIHDMTPLFKTVTLEPFEKKTALELSHLDIIKNPSKYKELLILNCPEFDTLMAQGIMPYKHANNIPIDYLTAYRFTRQKLDISGKLQTKVHTEYFTWSDALKAGLPTDKQGNLNAESAWQKWTKIMMRSKPYLFGAREIADDLLMGSRTADEYLDMDNIPNRVTEEGRIEILDKQGKPINQ